MGGLLFFTYQNSLYAQALEIGCSSIVTNRDKGCSQKSLLEEKSFVLESLIEGEKPIKEKKSSKQIAHKIKITSKLNSVQVVYQKKNFLIERVEKDSKRSCPPYCIQPMNIANIKTIGELETLDFIKKINSKQNHILIDSRTTGWYKQNTIPGATNIPHTLLKKKSQHASTILKLLGAKKLQGKWYFRNIHKLLIFDNGIWDNQATQLIQHLIRVNYPQDKILYYRGGIQSWKEAGLTLL